MAFVFALFLRTSLIGMLLLMALLAAMMGGELGSCQSIVHAWMDWSE